MAAPHIFLAPLSPLEIRLAGLVAFEWWAMDHFWFFGTVRGWW